MGAQRDVLAPEYRVAALQDADHVGGGDVGGGKGDLAVKRGAGISRAKGIERLAEQRLRRSAR